MENPQTFISLGHFVQRVGEAAAPDASPPTDLPSLFTLLSRVNDRLMQENRRLILAIDEYENLDVKIGEGVLPLDLLATLRESSCGS